MKHQDRTLRIIGGNWRGRKITFPDHDGIRPTGDRVRETLFNWLMHDIRGADCLDLFAGSGVLSIEALSRGASHVTMIDNNNAASARITENLTQLDADPGRFENINADVIKWLNQCNTGFDIVFIDPPFASDLLTDILKRLADQKIARNLVYIETPEELDACLLPDQWRIHRQKRTGAVHYCLCISG